MDDFVSVTARDYQDCLTRTPQVIETSRGPVEYAVHGQGPVLLSVHGSFGGHDQGLALAECFRKNGFTVVAVSRPGYLGTPLGRGTTPEAQADVLAALVEALDLGPVAVAGASAGGPPSYALALRHPELVTALVEIDSVSMRYARGEEMSRVEKVFFLSKPGLWFADWCMRRFPRSTIRGFLKSASTLTGNALEERAGHVVSDPDRLAFIQLMTGTMSHDWGRRKQGVLNDLAFLAGLDPMPVAGVRCPALVVHGDADGDVPFEHGRYAAQTMPDAELLTVPGGSHFGFWMSDAAQEVQARAVAWLKETLSRQK